jgi:outer membrane immunogenic protein
MKSILSIVAVTALTVTSASAADLPARPIYKAPVSAPAFDWSGPYVGAHIGYAWGHEGDNLSQTLPPAPTPADRFSVDGVIGGIHAGYNWQTGRFVYGLEGDFDGSGIKGSAAFEQGGNNGYFGTLSLKNDWQASIRARAGYAADNWLFYVTGGVAFARVKSTLDASSRFVDDFQSSANQTLTGWTIGIGAEHPLSKNWIARAEFRYTDFGYETAQLADGFGDPVPTRVRFDDARAILGISYKF